MTKHPDYCFLKWAVNGPDHECGDTGFIRMGEEDCFLALIDVLGHGVQAHEVALTAERFLEANHADSLVDLMNGLHEHLKGSRGAVAAFCRLDPSTGDLRYVGVGNINVRLFGMSPYHFVPRDGIVGYQISRPREEVIHMERGDILVMSSDGLREHFSLEEYPGLLKGNAEDIAIKFMKYLIKKDDDASCITLRFEP